MLVPPRKFLSVVYAWAVERIPGEKREQWEFDLDAPLPGREAKEPSEEDLQREFDDFSNFMNSVKAG